MNDKICYVNLSFNFDFILIRNWLFEHSRCWQLSYYVSTLVFWTILNSLPGFPIVKLLISLLLWRLVRYFRSYEVFLTSIFYTKGWTSPRELFCNPSVFDMNSGWTTKIFHRSVKLDLTWYWEIVWLSCRDVFEKCRRSAPVALGEWKEQQTNTREWFCMPECIFGVLPLHSR